MESRDIYFESARLSDNIVGCMIPHATLFFGSIEPEVLADLKAGATLVATFEVRKPQSPVPSVPSVPATL